MTGGLEPGAQDAFRLLMRDHIAPALRDRGFKGTAASTVFWSLTGPYAMEIAFVKSRHSSRASVDFWAELAVHYIVIWLVTINRTEARKESGAMAFEPA